MTSIEQIQNDIQTLPPEAQDLLIDFIQLLKKRYPETKTENIDVSPESRSLSWSGYWLLVICCLILNSNNE